MVAKPSDHPKSKVQAVDYAIQLALASKWEAAVAVNQDLLDRFGPDADTHNRLGKALLELGRRGEAEASYRAATELNPLNQIAQRQLAKLREREDGRGPAAPTAATLDIKFFTEEPGKTVLTRVVSEEDCEPGAVAPGEPIELAIGSGQVMVRSVRGAEVGTLEPRIAQRLRRMVDGGNRYAGAVAHVEGGSVQVILREVYQAPEMAGTVSFPVRKGRELDYRPYAKETLLARDDDQVVMDDDDGEPLAPRPPRASNDMEEGFEEFEELDDAADSPGLDEDDPADDDY
ncbi:MAG: hypothetical protein ACYCZN_10150 [Candidatus Dormibacteria bacterium]